MKFKFDINYSEEEMKFLEENNCDILSEITLSKTNFSDNEIPRRMFRYCGDYIGEIIDDEDGKPIWAVLSKLKGVYHFSQYYKDLYSLQQGL